MGTDMDRSATYGFLLTIVTMDLSRTISDMAGDFSPKLHSHPPCISPPHPHWRGSLGIGYRHRSEKTGM